MWKCALSKKQKNIAKNFKLCFSGTEEKLEFFFWRHNSMTKLRCTLFKYENKREMGWDNQLKTFHFTQMRWRLEKGYVLGWTTSYAVSTIDTLIHGLFHNSKRWHIKNILQSNYKIWCRKSFLRGFQSSHVDSGYIYPKIVHY